MTQEVKCAACGKPVLSDATSVCEGGNVFCDTICRADYHKGTRYAPPPPAVPAKKPLAGKQRKYAGRVVEGVVSILLGLILTWWSRKHGVLKGYYVIFYGPVLWGFIAIMWGAIGLWKSKKPPTLLAKYMP